MSSFEIFLTQLALVADKQVSFVWDAFPRPLPPLPTNSWANNLWLLPDAFSEGEESKWVSSLGLGPVSPDGSLGALD